MVKREVAAIVEDVKAGVTIELWIAEIGVFGLSASEVAAVSAAGHIVVLMATISVVV